MKRFDDVKIGETFVYDNYRFKRISTITDENGDDWNVVRLLDDNLWFFYNEDWVEEYPFIEREVM